MAVGDGSCWAPGGVARDYLNLTQKALRIANEREENPSRLHNRISAEDVNEAAADMASQKQDDLRRDASTDADKLRARLTDIVKFCLDVNKTNVFLVEGPNLREAEWGTEIQALADLRFIHQIGNISVQTGKYRGKKFLGFTLDLSNYTSTRSERSITQIEFWTTAGKQSVRRSSLIYELGASDRAPVRTGAATDVGEDLPGTWGDKQIDIFELLAEDAAKPPNSDA